MKLDAKLTEILEKKKLLMQSLKEAEEIQKPTEENSASVIHSVEHVTETFKEVTVEDKPQPLKDSSSVGENLKPN